MKQKTVNSLKQRFKVAPRTKLAFGSAVSDLEGHYDVDGVSFACGQVIVASDAKAIVCLSEIDKKIKVQNR